MDRVAGASGQVAYAHDPLRQRAQRAGLPWDESLLVAVRWAAQAAAAALAGAALDAFGEDNRYAFGEQRIEWQQQQ